MKQSTLGDFDPNKPDTSWPSAWKEWHPVIIAWIFYMIFINISDIYFDNFSFVIRYLGSCRLIPTISMVGYSRLHFC